MLKIMAYCWNTDSQPMSIILVKQSLSHISLRQALQIIHINEVL